MLRLAVLSMRTHRRHIDLALRVLREQVAATDDAATQSACSEGDSIAIGVTSDDPDDSTKIVGIA